MNLQSLKAEIDTDPLALGYAAYVVAAPGCIADLMNAVTNLQMYRSRMISERGVMDHYEDGPVAADAVLSKLEAFAQTAHPMAGVIRRTLKFLAQPDGIDIGSARGRTMLDALAVGGVLTSDESTKLKALALSPCSRAEQLFGVGARVTENEVREAINGNV